MSPTNTGSVLNCCAESTDDAWSTENEYHVDEALASPEASAEGVDWSGTIGKEFVEFASESEYGAKIESSEANWLPGFYLIFCGS